MSNAKRAKTPANAQTPAPDEVALQQTLLGINQDPRVIQAMNEHLIESNARLRAKLTQVENELEAHRENIPRPPVKRTTASTKSRGKQG